MGDRQHPRPQVRVRAQSRIGAHRGQEGLLEDVVGVRSARPRRRRSATRRRGGRRGTAGTGSRGSNGGGRLVREIPLRARGGPPRRCCRRGRADRPRSSPRGTAAAGRARRCRGRPPPARRRGRPRPARGGSAAKAMCMPLGGGAPWRDREVLGCRAGPRSACPRPRPRSSPGRRARRRRTRRLASRSATGSVRWSMQTGAVHRAQRRRGARYAVAVNARSASSVREHVRRADRLAPRRTARAGG